MFSSLYTEIVFGSLFQVIPQVTTVVRPSPSVPGAGVAGVAGVVDTIVPFILLPA